MASNCAVTAADAERGDRRMVSRRHSQVGGWASVEAVVEDMAAGRMFVVEDDEAGHGSMLVLAAECVTAEAISFISRQAGGWACLALSASKCRELGLTPIGRSRDGLPRHPLMATFDAREGITAGISAQDQAHTILTAIAPGTTQDDIVLGGHVQPLIASEWGVLARAGHTEAAVDIARLADRRPAAIICQIQDQDGAPADASDVRMFCARNNFRLVALKDLIAYRRRHERVVEHVIEVDLPTSTGPFRTIGYRSLVDGHEHIALVCGQVSGSENVLARVHAACLTGDVFHSLRCDCNDRLEAALAMIQREGQGVLVYLAQQGGGVGMLDRLLAYEREESEADLDAVLLHSDVPVTGRDSALSAQIFSDLGVASVRLLSDDASRAAELRDNGTIVACEVPFDRLDQSDRIGRAHDGSDLGAISQSGTWPQPSVRRAEQPRNPCSVRS